MAKKCLLILVLAGMVAGGVFAQEAEGVQEAAQEAQKANKSDFSSAAPQFFSFDIGAGVGYALDSKLPSQNFGVTVIGFKVTVIDNLEAGIDVLGSPRANVPSAFVGLRVGYRFTPVLGAAIGIGMASVQRDTIWSGGPAKPGISLGVFYDLFGSRSVRGIATALKVRVDYVAETSDLGKGVLLFTPVFTIGL